MLIFSLKGIMRKPDEVELLKCIIRMAIVKTKAKIFIVYSVSGNDAKVHEIFSDAEKKGINVIIPDNSMKKRNLLKC